MTDPHCFAVAAGWMRRGLRCALLGAVLLGTVLLGTVLLGAACEPGPGGVQLCACSDPACTTEACDPSCDSGCAGGRCDRYTGLCTVCGNGVCDVGEKPSTCAADCASVDQLDLLFVIDNSGSMAEGQYTLSARFSQLLEQLYTAEGQAPDLHIGVTSTNLGSGNYDINQCGSAGGDDGRLLVRTGCGGPLNANYLEDAAPRGCDVTMAADGTCSAHDCTDLHCGHAAGTTLVPDPLTGCPRCRNFSEDLVEELFPCMASLGTLGCGYEQSLEAMKRALDNHPDNHGFLRPDSVLAVVILTDEDDCSAADPEFFDDTQETLQSYLGPFSYRCFEWGTTCDTDDRMHRGPRHNCVPRSDTAALLHPVDRYVDFLRSLRDPGRIVIAAVTGPVTPTADGSGFEVTVEAQDSQNPAPAYSCSSSNSGAIPAIRVRTVVSGFHQLADEPGMFGSICAFDTGPTLPEIGARIMDALR